MMVGGTQRMTGVQGAIFLSVGRTPVSALLVYLAGKGLEDAVESRHRHWGHLPAMGPQILFAAICSRKKGHGVGRDRGAIC